MSQNRLRAFTAVAVVTLLSIIPSHSLHAQKSCSIRLLPGYAVSTYREHVADKFSFFAQVGGPTFQDEAYGVSYTPIHVRGAGALTLGGGIECKNPRNGLTLGITGLNSYSMYRTGGLVSTPAPSDLTRLDISGVKMFGQTLVPVIDQRNKSGMSDVKYWASARIINWSAKAYALKDLVGGGSTSLAFGVGLRVSGLQIRREEGQSQQAFVYDGFGPFVNYQNDITLRSQAETSVRFAVGPEASTRIRFGIAGAQAEVNASMGLLRGSVREHGFWHDTDDIHQIHEAINGTFTDGGRVTLLDGRFPYESRHMAILRVSDLSASLSRPLFGRVSLNPTVSFATWHNVPNPPQWRVPGSWTWSNGSGWNEQSGKNLNFFSGTLGISIGF